MSSGNSPNRLIRFYGNPEFALECLTFKEISFIRVTKFNDPFDPYIDIPTTFRERYGAIIEWLQMNQPSKVEQFKQKIPKNVFDQKFAQTRKTYKEIRKNCFAFCMFEKKENNQNDLYMWGHYANGHRGIALEFDPQLIHDSIKKRTYAHDDSLIKIRYEKNLNSAAVTPEDFFSFIQGDRTRIDYKTRILMTLKGETWKPEAEWRFLLYKDEIQTDIIRDPIPDNAITSVFLGCELNAEYEKKIVLTARKNFPQAQIYKARKRLYEFDLEFEELTAEE